MKGETMNERHIIEADYRNAYGQRVVVLACPVIQRSVAVNDAPACTCGTRI